MTITFERLTLKGTTPHANTVLEFTNGVHIVRGANFSGKSSAFQMFANIVTGEMPYAASKSKRENQGTGAVKFTKDGHVYEIIMNMATGRLTIREDNATLDYRRVAGAQAKAAELLPMTLPAFQNFAYLSNDTFPILLRGSPSQRKGLFEQLFDIDTSGQYKRLRMIETSMTLAKAKMAALMESAGNVTWIRAVNDLEASISRIERELAALRPEFEKSQAYLAIERSAEDALDRHPELEGLGLEGLQARLAQVDPRALTEELATASVLRKQSEDYERFSRAFIACENVPVVISDFVEAFCQTEQETESFLSLCKILKRIDSIPEPPERFDTRKIEHDLHAAERKLASLEHAKECPTCGASLRTGAKGIVAAIRKEIAILSDELSVAQSADAEYRRYSNVYEHDVFLVAGYSDIKRLHAHIDDALAVIEFLRTPTVARPKLTPRSEADIRSDLNACMDLSRAIDELIRFCKTEEPQVIVNEREIVNLETRRDALKEQLLEARVKHRSWSELTRDAARYAMQCRNLDVVSVLKDMYGPKGLRLARIKDAAQAYVDNLNRVSGLAFTNYKFAADVSDSGIVITCERPSGVSDIRRFSGAEGKLLPILSLLALHDILPDAHKSNVLILDEVEAGMRRDTRQRYVDLLPELQAIYPSLWIVTPLQRSEFDIILPECDVIEHTVRMSGGKAIVETET